MKSILIAALLLFAVCAEAEIVRDPAQVRAFRRINPCPSTDKLTGPCPGWVVDHTIPLCAGGQDHPNNMQWQDRAAALQKDKLEWWVCRKMKQCAGQVNG